jgi:hypothetical protein
MYLDEAGVRALDGVAGLPLTKLRHRVAGPPDSHTPDSGYAGTGGAVVVDVFEGELDGLILAEVELGEGVAMGDHPFATEYSRFITAETTRDERYGGGSLAEFGHPDRTPDAPSVMVVWHSDHGERGATRPLAEAAQRGVEAARAMLGGPLDLRVQIRRAIDVYAADLASTDLVVWVTPHQLWCAARRREGVVRPVLPRVDAPGNLVAMRAHRPRRVGSVRGCPPTRTDAGWLGLAVGATAVAPHRSWGRSSARTSRCGGDRGAMRCGNGRGVRVAIGSLWPMADEQD